MKASRVRFFLVFCASCLAVYTVGRAQQAQQQPQRPQQPTFRAGVSAVRVDVIVTDREGKPADNLTAADFEVVEDGKPQTVNSFKLIRVQTRQEPGGEAPRAIRTFDDEATELARDDVRIIVILLDDYHVSRVSAINLRAWLRRFVERQIGAYDLVALMYPLTPTSALTFTRDRFALASAIDRFEGRRGDYMPRNDLEANYAAQPPWQIEQIRGEVVASAIKSVCYHLGTLNEGRKSLIVVAETLFAPTSDLREVIEAANRNNVSIYPLDPQGLSMFGTSGALHEMADNTNGRAITERNDLESALAVVLRDSSAYYLLGYNSDKGTDGKFHEIKVRVKKPGLEVRARKGYWALTAGEAAEAAEPAKPAAPADVTEALAALAQPPGRLIRTWLGLSRGDNGKTRVTFVWEPAAAVQGSAPMPASGRVLLLASGVGGATYFDGAVGATPPSRAVFYAPPGKVQIKVTVQASASASAADVLESDTREITVPDLAGPRVTLSTPAVFNPRTPREFRASSSDAAAVPTATREFSRTDRLLIRFDAYGPGPAAPAVTARLLNRHGDQMTTLPAQANSQRAGQYTIDLPLSNLARGDYVIEVAATGQAGEAKQLLAVRVQ